MSSSCIGMAMANLVAPQVGSVSSESERIKEVLTPELIFDSLVELEKFARIDSGPSGDDGAYMFSWFDKLPPDLQKSINKLGIDLDKVPNGFRKIAEASTDFGTVWEQNRNKDGAGNGGVCESDFLDMMSTTKLVWAMLATLKKSQLLDMCDKGVSYNFDVPEYESILKDGVGGMLDIMERYWRPRSLSDLSFRYGTGRRLGLGALAVVLGTSLVTSYLLDIWRISQWGIPISTPTPTPSPSFPPPGILTPQNFGEQAASSGGAGGLAEKETIPTAVEEASVDKGFVSIGSWPESYNRKQLDVRSKNLKQQKFFEFVNQASYGLNRHVERVSIFLADPNRLSDSDLEYYEALSDEWVKILAGERAQMQEEMGENALLSDVGPFPPGVVLGVYGQEFVMPYDIIVNKELLEYLNSIGASALVLESSGYLHLINPPPYILEEHLTGYNSVNHVGDEDKQTIRTAGGNVYVFIFSHNTFGGVVDDPDHQQILYKHYQELQLIPGDDTGSGTPTRFAYTW